MVDVKAYVNLNFPKELNMYSYSTKEKLGDFFYPFIQTDEVQNSEVEAFL